MHICITTSKYPNIVEPAGMVFVQQLAWSFADLGNEVTIICPLNVLNNIYKNVDEYKEEITYKGNKVNVYFPKFIGFGQLDVFGFKTANLTIETYQKACLRVIKRIKKPDIMYGHFAVPSGVVANRIGKKLNIPSFFAYGESSLWSVDSLSRKKVKRLLEGLNGCISVSTANKDEIVGSGVIDAESVSVFPNGYNPSRFNPKNKEEARKKLNIPNDKFVVAFTGYFVEKKGIHILTQAINELDDVYLIAAGQGDLKPEGKSILYANLVKPDELAWHLSAADVFVLPTTQEGCCNGIIEAMACGLPIISSNYSFNDDILDDTNSIRIDPLKAEEVKEAIIKLKDNKELKEKLARGSLNKSKELTIEKRAINILNYMKERSEK